jgi:hypothetical protein
VDSEISGAGHSIGCSVRSGTFAYTCPQSDPNKAARCTATAQTVGGRVTAIGWQRGRFPCRIVNFCSVTATDRSSRRDGSRERRLDFGDQQAERTVLRSRDESAKCSPPRQHCAIYSRNGFTSRCYLFRTRLTVPLPDCPMNALADHDAGIALHPLMRRKNAVIIPEKSNAGCSRL